jgi:ParB family chromosome partitioning protein
VEGLAASIGKLGLLQPLTITPDGVLICGARRLAAIKLLGIREVSVWVSPGLSGRLAGLMAERDDVVCHKDYSPLELAEMYAELKAEFAAEAARREEAHQFQPKTRNPRSDGIVDSTTPLGEPTGDSREQAAKMLGGPSYNTLERVLAVKQIAADPERGPQVRGEAADALARIDRGEPVDPLFQRVRSLARVDDLDKVAADPSEPPAARDAAGRGVVMIRRMDAESPLPPAEMDQFTQTVRDKVEAARRAHAKTQAAAGKPAAQDRAPAAPRAKLTARQFAWLWQRIAGWPSDYDPEAVAREVADADWASFKRTMAEGARFMEAVDAIRAALAETPGVPEAPAGP